MKQKHILLADDDRELCAELSNILEENDYSVCCVHTGEDVIKKIKKEKFDMVLLDLKMPGIGGVETFRKIRKINPSLPVIIITAVLSSEVEKGFQGLETPPVIYKPFGIAKIMAHLKRVSGDAPPV
ncbi:MAG: response regulator [Candidatus Omnitrophota bacterium]|nr:response regulator [Candidatus Omnitrophota bacterium]